MLCLMMKISGKVTVVSVLACMPGAYQAVCKTNSGNFEDSNKAAEKKPLQPKLFTTPILENLIKIR